MVERAGFALSPARSLARPGILQSFPRPGFIRLFSFHRFTSELKSIQKPLSASQLFSINGRVLENFISLDCRVDFVRAFKTTKVDS